MTCSPDDRIAADASLAMHVRRVRRALVALRWEIEDYCLPDEPAACGNSFADHLAMYLGALQATADHLLEHGHASARNAAALHRQEMVEKLRANCPL